MKPRLHQKLFGLLALVACSLQPATMMAQSTAFTYQGRLNDGMNPANGFYDLRFSIYDSTNLPGDQIAGTVTNSTAGVSNGLFTATMDFGADVFTGSNYWLEVAVRTNGSSVFSVLSPRQAITPTPYALYAPSAGNAAFAATANSAVTATTAAVANAIGSIVNTNVAQLNVPNTTVPATGTVTVVSGFVVGVNLLNGGSGYAVTPVITVIDASGSNVVITATVTNGIVSGLAIQSAGNNYSTNAILVIAAPASNAAQIFGTANNFTGINTLTNGGNQISGTFSGNGGSLTNVNAMTLGGLTSATFWKTTGNSSLANTNYLGTPDNVPLELRVNGVRALRLEPKVVAGGFGPNLIGGYFGNLVDAAAYEATIGGGGETNYINHVSSTLATVSGGSGNIIQTNSNDSTISGGRQNQIGSGNWGGFIGGGHGNWIQAGNNPGSGGGLGGPYTSYSSIVGGWGNTILSNAYEATIGGGEGNSIGSVFSVIAGGRNGYIAAQANDAGIASGTGDTIQYGAYNAFIGGGYTNIIGTNSYRAVIGGGTMNIIQTNSPHAIIVGGQNNLIQANVQNAFIGGGWTNVIQTNASYAVLAGGYQNSIQANAGVATISGGGDNINAGYGADIAGGWANSIQTNAYQAVIGGGLNNSIAANSSQATIAGGFGNSVSSVSGTISGGTQNTVSGYESVVAGGANNNATGVTSFVGGGYGNVAGGASSFAGGQSALATNDHTFVWSDGSTNTVSTSTNQFMARASGGVIFYSGTDTNTGVSLAAGSGSWSSLSDRNTKDDFTPVDPQEVLERVSALPMQTWHYKAQGENIRHLGPVAQDFHAAFGLGEDERHISTIDSEGVALAAIQGLNRKLDEKDVELQKLQQQNESLANRLHNLELTIQSLAQKR